MAGFMQNSLVYEEARIKEMIESTSKSCFLKIPVISFAFENIVSDKPLGAVEDSA